MDTKLKKYNRAKRTGIIITVLAAALFVALFPLFRYKAEQYLEEGGREGLEDEIFIQSLIRSNYVFYKNVLDKGGSKIYSYEELYMDKVLEDISESSVDYNIGEGIYEENTYVEDGSYTWETEVRETVDKEQLNSIVGLYVGQIQDAIASIQDIVDAIGTSMDYYVLDKSTGASVKNTSLPIDELLIIKGYVNAEGSSDMSDEYNTENGGITDIEAEYEYYIIMDYDSYGNLQNISVKGKDADKLLKTVRSLESSSNGRILRNRYETEKFTLYDEEEGRETKQLTITQKKPENVTFIYAVTAEQMQLFKNKGYASAHLGANYGMSPIFHSYYQAGVDSAYILFFSVIFIITVLLAVFRPLALEGVKERKAPIEAVVIAAGVLLVFSIDGPIRFIANVESGDVVPWVSEFLELLLPEGAEYAYISEIVCGIVKYAISFCVFAFIFAIWYFLCMEVSDIVRDVKKYISTRCLTYIILRKTCAYIKRSYKNFKAEVMSADLGKDMDKLLKKLVIINFCLLMVISFFWAFGIPLLVIYSFVIYYIFKKYIRKVSAQYKNLLNSVGSIAHGSLNNTFEEDFGIFESSKEELCEIQNGFKNAVDKEVKSQMMKTELITNVSHDLKTPLTAIITYIDLMKEENITEEQRKIYLDTLEKKSLRLKVLIEDLFEVSRATSGNISLDMVPVDICNLMRQVYLEHEDKMKEAGLQVRFNMPDGKVILQLDSQKTYRIFENLYGNIIKYALHETRVFIEAEKREQKDGTPEGIHIEIKNISAQEIVGDPQYLSERFVRGDASRNTEGSGLGLAIARSFTELQGGTFRIETDGDLFKVILEWG
ncbi:MAG: HAMP domain-containing histidine kinase [Lachnospiraceae bacterium]|nr:HAMP domain-containing histidine kinase [Lachnospiraceae bacterium]